MGSTCSIIRLVKILLNHGVTAGVRGGRRRGGRGRVISPQSVHAAPLPPPVPSPSHLASPPERLIKLLTVNRFRALNIDDLIHFIKTQTRYVISWVAWGGGAGRGWRGGRQQGGRCRRVPPCLAPHHYLVPTPQYLHHPGII